MGISHLNTEVLLELIFSIETDASEEDVLKKCCPTFIRKLNGFMVAVFQQMPNEIVSRFSLPIAVKNTSSWQYITQFIDNNPTLHQRNFWEFCEEDNYWYIYSLHEYGYFVLGRKKQIDFGFQNELVSVFSFMAKILTKSLEKQRRLEAERKVADEHRLLRTIIDNLPINVYVKDLHCRKILANQSEIAHLGASSEAEVLNQDDSAFYPAQDADRFREEDLRVLQGESVLSKESLIGKDKWALISKVPLKDSSGNTTGLVGISVDITERKKMEDAMVEAKRIAEHARMAEKQFLANMSHEIRTPLNAIIGMAHLLFDTRPTKQQFEYLQILKSSSDFLHSLISDLLDMSKIDAGRLEAQKRPFDLVGLLRTTHRIFEMKLQNRPIELEFLIDARINGLLESDEILINQILLNLIGNAEKFTEKGSIEINVKLKKEEEELVWIEFRIRDTGIGIPPDKLEEIFQKFKQVNTDGSKHKGTGLGLSITKQIVELLGGSISVKSSLGEGSTFLVLLPMNKVAPKPLDAEAPAAPAPSPTSGRKALVVEDNLMNQKYICSLLDKWYIDYDLASDGQRGVELAAAERYDVILMDIQMPNMDGYEATLRIRNTHNPNQQTPIIALTASAILDQKNKTTQVGMDGFLTKPFAPRQLLELLEKYLTVGDVAEPPAQSQSALSLDQAKLREM